MDCPKIISAKVMIFRAVILSLLLASMSVGAQTQQNPYIYVLGVAQDAGFPQADCFKGHCMPGWKNSKKRIGAISLALIIANTDDTYLFEAAPHFPEQLYLLKKNPQL